MARDQQTSARIAELTRAQTSARIEELTRGLAETTGVAAEDVAKVLDRLGLEGAIANRLDNITVDHMRVALGPESL